MEKLTSEPSRPCVETVPVASYLPESSTIVPASTKLNASLYDFAIVPPSVAITLNENSFLFGFSSSASMTAALLKSNSRFVGSPSTAWKSEASGPDKENERVPSAPASASVPDRVKTKLDVNSPSSPAADVKAISVISISVGALLATAAAFVLLNVAVSRAPNDPALAKWFAVAKTPSASFLKSSKSVTASIAVAITSIAVLASAKSDERSTASRPPSVASSVAAAVLITFKESESVKSISATAAVPSATLLTAEAIEEKAADKFCSLVPVDPAEEAVVASVFTVLIT